MPNTSTRCFIMRFKKKKTIRRKQIVLLFEVLVKTVTFCWSHKEFGKVLLAVFWTCGFPVFIGPAPQIRGSGCRRLNVAFPLVAPVLLIGLCSFWLHHHCGLSRILSFSVTFAAAFLCAGPLRLAFVPSSAVPTRRSG